MYKCSEEKLPCSPVGGGAWCSAKLPCGRCLEDKIILSCKNERINFTPNCDDCKHRFKCWTSRPVNLPLNDENYRDLNSFIAEVA